MDECCTCPHCARDVWRSQPGGGRAAYPHTNFALDGSISHVCCLSRTRTLRTPRCSGLRCFNQGSRFAGPWARCLVRLDRRLLYWNRPFFFHILPLCCALTCTDVSLSLSCSQTQPLCVCAVVCMRMCNSSSSNSSRGISKGEVLY